MSNEPSLVLKSFVELVRRGKQNKITDDQIKQLFSDFFGTIPYFDMMQYERAFRAIIGYIDSQSLLYLARRWNSFADSSQQLDLEVFLKPYKDFLREKLNSIESLLLPTTYLKTIFNEQWFAEVNRLIDTYVGDGAFKSDTHTFFIGFIQENAEGGNLIIRLDEAFKSIASTIGQQRIRSLMDKLRDVSRSLKDYLGVVYEILILGSLAQKGLLLEYEPKVGNNYAEGRISVSGFPILIEATVVTTGRDINFLGTIDIEKEARKISGKILDKATQLKAAQEPILLFLSPHTMTLPQEIKMGISQAFEQAGSYLICGVVASDYRGNNCKFLKNSNPAAKQLPDEVWRYLIREYKMEELDLSSAW